MISKILLTAFILSILLFSSSVSAVNRTCISSNTTLQVNTTYYVKVNGVTTPIDLTKEIYCTFGCDATNNICKQELGEYGSSSLALPLVSIFATVIFFILGMHLELKLGLGMAPRILDVLVILNSALKIFFFIMGFIFLVNTLGIARNMAIYGASGAEAISLITLMTTNTMQSLYFFLGIVFTSFLISIILHFVSSARRPKGE